jgi:hypothetical protein
MYFFSFLQAFEKVHQFSLPQKKYYYRAYPNGNSPIDFFRIESFHSLKFEGYN